MSDTYFSKLDPKEKESRLVQLGNSKGQVTIWLKGQKFKANVKVLEYDKERLEIILDTKDHSHPKGSSLLCSFELRGMFFFSEVTVNTSIVGHMILEIKGQLFKSEKRGSYRLMTYPIYDVSVEFEVGEDYQGGKVVNLKNRNTQTGLFKSFLKLMDTQESTEIDKTNQNVKFRVQDLSATGLSLHIGEIESEFFSKDAIYKDVKIIFLDETIVIPEVKVVYVLNLISHDKNSKKFKVGLHFLNNPTNVDDQLGKKINQLLREIDFNKDFESFTK